MDIIINKSLVLNFIITFIAMLFIILISIQFTLNKILKEIREIRILKAKSQHNDVKNRTRGEYDDK